MPGLRTAGGACGGERPARNGVPFALELSAPTGQHAVDALCADDRLVGNRKVDRVEDERPRLRGAQVDRFARV